MPSHLTENPKPNFFNLFCLYFKISAITVGGGYVIVPVIQRAFEKKKWLDDDVFYDTLSVAQSLPGPIALNCAMFSGYKVLGISGLLAGFLGIIIPPFFTIIIVAALINGFSSNVYLQYFLSGASAVIPGLTASLAFNMIKKRKWTTRRIILTVAATTAIILSKSWTIPVFFVSAIVAWLFEGSGEMKGKLDA